MPSKKMTMNEKEATLVDFFTEIYPQKFIKALKVLLDLNYPISDKKTFRDEVAKTALAEYVQHWLIDSFYPTDFSLHTPMNAMEKFYYRYTAHKETNWKHRETETNNYYPSEHFLEPAQRLFDENQARFDRRNTYQQRHFQQAPHAPKTYQQTVMTRFGNDACGRASETAWLDFICQGWQPDSALKAVHKRCQEARELMPDYGTGWIAKKAQVVFANQFIILGKSQYLANQAAQTLMNRLRKRNFTQRVDFNREEYAGASRFEEEIVYN